MRLWPFAKKEVREEAAPAEPSTKERLLTRNCGREEFFLLYSKLLQERMPNCRVEFSGESVLRIVDANGKESTTFLDNLWLKYRDGTEDRSELIEKYIRIVGEMGKEDPPLLKVNVIPTIRDAQYLGMAGTQVKLVREHLCGDLWVVYAEDRPESIKTVTRESLVDAGISESDVRALAIENLKRILPPAEVHGGGPWYLLRAGNDYVASVILLEHLGPHRRERYGRRRHRRHSPDARRSDVHGLRFRRGNCSDSKEVERTYPKRSARHF